MSHAARYDVYRAATTLDEYHSHDCGNHLRAAMDIARDVRCGHCSVGGIRTAEGLRAAYLSTHTSPVPAAAPFSVAPALAGGSAPHAAGAPASALPALHAPNKFDPTAGTAPSAELGAASSDGLHVLAGPISLRVVASTTSLGARRSAAPAATPPAMRAPAQPASASAAAACARLGDPPGLTAPSAAPSVVAAPVWSSTAAPFTQLGKLAKPASKATAASSAELAEPASKATAASSDVDSLDCLERASERLPAGLRELVKPASKASAASSDVDPSTASGLPHSASPPG